MNWIRVTNLEPYLKSEDLLESNESLNSTRRFYSQPNEAYPLLCIAIYYNDWTDPKGFTICTSIKHKAVEWWDSRSASIPGSLLNDLKDMIEEAERKLRLKILQ